MNVENTENTRPNCFIVMPFGRSPTEQRWFKGWYEVVIHPAVQAAGYSPILSASEEQPGAINDEIRAHLAFDPMVLVDLGGVEPEDDPNPNVMYELGIRHALGLPLVLMAWEGQRLPFDVANQRVIMLGRDFLDIETNKRKIINFMQAATEGKYYKPMEAVGRMAKIEAAKEELGEDSLLAVLIQEMKDLKSSIHTEISTQKPSINWNSTLSVKAIITGKKMRSDLYSYFQQIGGDPVSWGKLIKTRVSLDFEKLSREWTIDDWKKYIYETYCQENNTHGLVGSNTVALRVPTEIIEKVKSLLPEQPWPKGVHRDVMSQLGITKKQYDYAVVELIKNKVFRQQIDGILLDHEDS